MNAHAAPPADQNAGRAEHAAERQEEMKKSTRALALLLSLLMLLAALAGCAKQGETPAADTPAADTPASDTPAADTPAADTEKNSEHLTITVGYWDVDAALANRENDTVLKTIEEKFNVTFEPVNVTWDDYNQKFQLLASSDSLPDIFASDVRTTATFAEWANDGLLHEIPSDLSAYPNLAKYLDSPESDTCMVGDKMYCIFRQTYVEQAETVDDRSIVYRWDLAQKAGITEEPKTWDEFREMIQAIIKADPEGKNIQGMTACGPEYLVGVFFTYSMPAAVVGGNTFRWVDNGDGTYVPAYFAGKNLGDDAVATWQLLRDMYQESTIEADIALATNDQAYNKFLNGQCAAMLATGYAGPWDGMIQYWEEVNGTNYTDVVKCLDLMPSVDGNAYYWMWDYAWSESYFSSKVDDEKFDRILQIYDYLLSDEGVMLSRYGVEGETYEIVDGKYVQESPDARTVFPSINLFHDLVAWTPVEPYEYISLIPEDILAVTEARIENARNAPVPEFDSRYTDIFVSMGTDFGLSLGDDMLTIMTGDRPVEEMWQEIIDRYKAAGLEDIIQQVNDTAKELGYQG